MNVSDELLDEIADFNLDSDKIPIKPNHYEAREEKAKQRMKQKAFQVHLSGLLNELWPGWSAFASIKLCNDTFVSVSEGQSAISGKNIIKWQRGKKFVFDDKRKAKLIEYLDEQKRRRDFKRNYETRMKRIAQIAEPVLMRYESTELKYKIVGPSLIEIKIGTSTVKQGTFHEYIDFDVLYKISLWADRRVEVKMANSVRITTVEQAQQFIYDHEPEFIRLKMLGKEISGKLSEEFFQCAME